MWWHKSLGSQHVGGAVWRQEDPELQTRLRHTARPRVKIRKKKYTLIEGLMTILLDAPGRGLWSPQRDTHQHHHKAQRSSLFNSNSTFMRFHLCAVFRSQLMFALGGAESLFAGQSGNSEGRDRGQQKGDAVFSWRPAVTLGGLWTWSKYHSSP